MGHTANEGNGEAAADAEMLRLTISVWHPNCWTLEVTEQTDAGLLGHGVYTSDDGTAKGRFTVYGDSVDEVDALIEATRETLLTGEVMEIEKSHEVYTPRVSPPENTTRELFVEFDPENSIDESFISRGFIYDGPTRIESGRETWSVVAHHDRQRTKELLDEVREEMDAEIEVESITTSTWEQGVSNSRLTSQLSARQQEVFRHARRNGYYEWPRAVTARELADDFGVTKTTYLEHLRKAESKLLHSIE